MSVSIATLLEDFYDRYPDAQNSSDARALRIFNRADRIINMSMPLRHKTFDVNIVAGQGEYAFASITGGSEILKVFACHWVKNASAGGFDVLKPTNKSYLDQYYPGWQSEQAMPAPEMFTVAPNETDRVIALFPKPIGGTVSGYPIIRLFTSVGATLTSGSTLPGLLPHAESYLALSCLLYAQVHDRDAIARWNDITQYWMEDLERHVYGAVPYDHPNIMAALPIGGFGP